MKPFKAAFFVLAAACALAACKPPKNGPPAQQVAAPPSMNFTMKTNHRPDRIRVYSTVGGSQATGKVRVCLRNAASGRDKGLHFKRASGPKFVVKKRNQYSCGHYSPGRKTFYFWKNTVLGKMKLRATKKLDLSGYAGQQITFDWIQD